MTTTATADVIRNWWTAIDRAEFKNAAALASRDATIDWVLSGERMRIHDDWVAVNENYPGSWNAMLDDVLIDGNRGVSMATVFDRHERHTAISLFTLEAGLITRIVEYWPERYPAPAWRSRWTTPLEESYS